MNTHAVPAEGLPLGPGMRGDLIIDCMAKPGQHFAVRDLGRPPITPVSELGLLAYSEDILFQGGMRGQPLIGMVDGKPSRIQEIMQKQGLAWTMNYNAQHEHALMHEPFLHLK